MEDRIIDLTVHRHDWKVVQGMCVCTGKCPRRDYHPYGMFDDCEEGHSKVDRG